jgi:hypothetical protein
LNGWNGLNQPLFVRSDRVGNLNFVEKVQNELGFKAAHREVIESGGTYALREQTESYGSNFSAQNEALENTRFWNEDSEVTAT